MIQANTMNEKPTISFSIFNSDTYFPVLLDTDKEGSPETSRNQESGAGNQEANTTCETSPRAAQGKTENPDADKETQPIQRNLAAAQETERRAHPVKGSPGPKEGTPEMARNQEGGPVNAEANTASEKSVGAAHGRAENPTALAQADLEVQDITSEINLVGPLATGPRESRDTVLPSNPETVIEIDSTEESEGTQCNQMLHSSSTSLICLQSLTQIK